MAVSNLPCVIRRMRREDISQADEIDRDAFKTTVPPTNYRRELRNEIACYIVAVDSQQYIYGLAGFWLLAGEAHIVNLAVREQYCRRGIGKLLLANLIELALEKGASLITLEVRVSNIAAQNLYRKYGFDIKGIRPGYYLDNREDAVIMTAEDIDSAPFREKLNRLRQEHSRK
jgi:ribosomal-protein-alanine N-acetyltransferase